MEIARHVARPPRRRVVPPLSQAEDTPSMRRRFAKAVREEMDARKRALQDPDLRRRAASGCARTLADPRRAARPPAPGCASATTSSWSTSSRTPTRCSGTSCAGPSGRAGSTLVLIGDPKQAIYAFRGADVHAYLQAREAVQSGVDARRQLAQRPGAARGLRRAVRRRPARLRRHRLPAGPRRRGQPAAPARRRARSRAAAAPDPARRTTASSH